MTTDVGRTQHPTKHEARQRLEHERNSRLAQLRAIEESAPHADKGLQAAQTSAIRRVLEEIDAAGERLTDGSYGTCRSCRSAIPAERLEILPYVALCVGCQQRAL
ncbi:TraR/DksA family transcriptional regulator [Kribbella sp. NPDC049174]|uniref:TraR/DksA family transcriptional regulator n=1 Tax=Kribbella sp. NPDC049174 TaxID=3364112 RepID=UPI00371D65FD